jgi:hypothetical protein
MGDDGGFYGGFFPWMFFYAFYGVSMVFLWCFYGVSMVSMVFHGNLMESIGPKSTESFSP